MASLPTQRLKEKITATATDIEMAEAGGTEKPQAAVRPRRFVGRARADRAAGSDTQSLARPARGGIVSQIPQEILQNDELNKAIALVIFSV